MDSEEREQPWSVRYRMPILAIVIPTAIFIFRYFLEVTELAPDAFFPMIRLSTLSAVLGLLGLVVWFLFFSRFSLWAKVSTLVLVGLALGSVASLARRVEFTGQMEPIVHWVWQPDHENVLRTHLAGIVKMGANLTEGDVKIGPTDFPRFRGPHGDGVAMKLDLDVPTKPMPVVVRQPLGGGYSGFAVAGKIAITLEQRASDETVVGYDSATGKELWIHGYPAEFKHSEAMGGGGPRSTPTIADGDVYTLGATGELLCLAATNGKLRWQVNILTDNQAKNLEWGMTASPLVVGPHVIVMPGINPNDNQNQAIACYDRKTGTKVWAKGSVGAGYSTSVLAKLAGVDQIVLFDAGGLVGIDPQSGTELWRHTWTTFSNMNISVPLVLDQDRIFISSEVANGSALVQISKRGNTWKATPIWQNRNLAGKFGNPVVYQGHIYGLSLGFLTCLDVETGKRKWKDGRFGSGQLLLSGGTIWVQSETGDLVAVQANPAAYQERFQQQALTGKTWNTPTLAQGRFYLRNHREMVILDAEAK